MALFFKILDGAAAGHRFELRDGLVIGRQKADVNLQDSRVSSRHAVVELRVDGDFWLIDQNSSNGIRTQDGKVNELRLIAGQKFKLGRIRISVIASAEAPGESTQRQAASAAGVSSLADSDAGLNWRAALLQMAKNALVRRRPGQSVKAFSPLIELRFLRGLQAGQIWVIGYGPRSVGANSIDLRLEEPGIPGLCFQLVPESDGPSLVVHPSSQGEVRLNSRVVTHSLLRDGDIVDIRNTRMSIGLLKTEDE
jgi:pSer/pThr/pTyr-binding forkhead associated (FHA) protein